MELLAASDENKGDSTGLLHRVRQKGLPMREQADGTAVFFLSGSVRAGMIVTVLNAGCG